MARLGDICKFQSGGTPSKSNKSYFDGEIPWITTVALTGGIIAENDAIDWITEKALKESAVKLVPANSIMIGTRVGIGKVATNAVPMSTSQDIISLLEIDEAKWDKPFLCKWLASKSEYLQSQARGATIKGIKIETVANLAVPEMQIEDQRTISTILDKVSNLISLRKQQLAKLDESVKARFVEMFGGIPAEKYVTIKEVCKIITDGTHQPPKFVETGIPFLFVSNIVENRITYDTEKFISEATYSELIKRTPIEIGDILLSTVGSYGHPAVVKSTDRFCFQRHIAYLKPNNCLIDSDYFYGALLSNDVQQQIEERVKGVAQKTLNLSEIRTIHLPLPTMKAQQQFSTFTLKIDKSKLTIQQSLAKLEVLKRALMQKYFSGDIE